jgi:hypothetical protein
MNIVDALCLECETPIHWVSGTRRLCSACYQALSPYQQLELPLGANKVNSSLTSLAGERNTVIERKEAL